MIIAIILFSGMSIFLLTYLFLYKAVFNDSIEERVNYYASRKEKQPAAKKTRRKKLTSIKSLGIYKRWGKVVKSMGLGKRYAAYAQKEALRAGLLLRGEEIMVFQMASSILVGMILQLMLGSVFLSIGGALIGGIIPLILISGRKHKRYKAFNGQLSDAIALISNSLKVGHSFMQSVDSVVREMPNPMAEEFGKMLNEMRLGVQTDEALHNLMDRVVSRDLELMVTAIMIQRQTGGNLSGILDQITATIRDRIRIKSEVRTLTAQGRMSGIIISLLPIVLGIAITLIDKEYTSLLIERPIGKIMLLGAAISEVLGYFVIRKIVSIKM